MISLKTLKPFALYITTGILLAPLVYAAKEKPAKTVELTSTLGHSGEKPEPTLMVPTLGRKSPFYNSTGGHYWNGAVWVPTNTMVIKGLKKYGYTHEAREIAIIGLEGMYQTWVKTGTIWENYDQEKLGKPGEKGRKGEVCRTDFVGWSGVQPIATLIENIIGIQLNASENRIEWTLRMNEQNGVRNLKWGQDYSQKVDLVADARNSSDSPVNITVSSNAPFTLVVDAGFTKKDFTVGKGSNQTFVIRP